MPQTIQLSVTGMTCGHCVKSVTTALQGVSGVTSASVDLDSKSAVVEGDAVDAAKLIEAVKEEGYEAALK
ncbi:MAG: heavy-metal-associated domain-containing protein [Dehalococcoidia bacterium]|nr:MAG: heavy-metal-associated domain-containing protein [bacterium]MCE7929249.1 heavy-metal-associated domain-containing protein [Chloroflexi bacterium CFX7]MCK6565246.1 heavy-metal-associated domain-containing protein [Dehalococcoidia bacterium]MCL4230059.1 heavy-metal-associated domain-containing protein [Dehalococcoidia bacterium]NUQ54514.1 heavy-metal-associated domain-containing protein [Dehalococcoidia bacterium]